MLLLVSKNALYMQLPPSPGGQLETYPSSSSQGSWQVCVGQKPKAVWGSGTGVMSTAFTYIEAGDRSLSEMGNNKKEVYAGQGLVSEQ